METKLIKYWKIELFEGSISAALKGQRGVSLFFTGYSKKPLDLNVICKRDDHYVELFIEPDELASISIPISRIYEVKNIPVYEGQDSFLDAAKPMMKWLSDNQHPHTEVTITSNSAELFESQRLAKSDEFLKD